MTYPTYLQNYQRPNSPIANIPTFPNSFKQTDPPTPIASDFTLMDLKRTFPPTSLKPTSQHTWFEYAATLIFSYLMQITSWALQLMTRKARDIFPQVQQ